MLRVKKKRREFIALLGGAAASVPLAARAQQADELPTIGILGSRPATWNHWLGAFVLRLRGLGWIENRTVTIDYRWTEGRSERYAELGAEFARRKVDCHQVPARNAGHHRRERGDLRHPDRLPDLHRPGRRWPGRLSRTPGGNITGLSNQQADLAGKRLGILRDIVPGLRQLAVLNNAGNRTAALSVAEVQLAARKLGLEIVSVGIKRADDTSPSDRA